ncbi:MAG: hypothetical protein JW801_02500 [Bacteroidales bacterium]|nr:hypothetical protein [Bacteroidales bacterium]
MQFVKTLFFALVTFSLSTSCSSQSDKNEATTITKSDQVEVYYFHFSRRCITCQAVEDVAKEAVAELSSDKVSFRQYNLEEKAGTDKAKQLGVSGQTLLIVGGDTKINLTNDGFMHAKSNPEKLKQIIKEKINLLL